MNKLRALVFGFSLLALGGCSTLQSVDLPTAEKSLTISHYAYEGVSQVILQATKSGALKGQNAAQVKIYYDKAGKALDAADAADKAANASDVNAQIKAFTDAVNTVRNLVGK